MSNNMCSLENGSTKHSMPPIVSSCSPSFTCSPLMSKPFGSHLFGSMTSSLPLHPPSNHTAFPFPPNPLFLSSLNIFNPQSSMSWFSAHNSLNTPLSLTTNDSKDMTSIANDNNNNITKTENKYKDSTQAMVNQIKNNLYEKSTTDSMVTNSAVIDSKISNTLSNPSPNESERNTTRNHSDNLNWLAEVAISSRGLPSGPPSPPPTGSAHSLSLPLNHQSSHPSQRSLFHPSLGNDMASGQRLYSPRFGSSSSPTYISYPTPNSPIGPLNAMNGVRPTPPPSAHFSGPFLSNFNAYQQFSPTSAQNTISPFLVPNQLSGANTRTPTYSTGITGIVDSYHNSQNGHNSHNAILSANSCSIASQSRSPSIHSSDSSSLLSSGPFSSPTISSESAEPQTKSMMRSIKDPIDSHNDISARSGPNEANQPLVSTGVKRKSLSSPEVNSNEKNLYKLPFGKEGSRKHRILKPPNISIIDPNHLMALQSAPLSAPPIPGVRRQEFLKRISDSDIVCYSNESIADQNNCHNITSFAHQRRKSVPQLSQTLSHKPFATFAAKEDSTPDSHYSVANENCLPTEEHNRLQYPIYFRKGSIIQLGNGSVKRVEEMSTQDFIDSANNSPDLCADCSEVIKIDEKIKSRSVLLSFNVGRTKTPVTITVEAPIEHPFYTYNKGWSSCCPEKSQSRYGLKCRKLRVGDNCISLTPRTIQTKQKSNKIQMKSLAEEETNRNKSKAKPQLSSQKTRSPSQLPLSLVKSTAPAITPVTASATDLTTSLNSDCVDKRKPNELLVTKVDSSVSKVPEVSDVSDMSNLSDNVPMSSSKSEAVNRNRRHSAPDAIDIESEPSSNAS